MHSILTLLWNVDHPAGAIRAAILGADLLALLTIPSVLIRRAGKPLAALSWILALVSLPVVGLLLWWLLGRTHLERHTRRRRGLQIRWKEPEPREPVPEELRPIVRRLLPFAVPGRRWTEGVFPPVPATSVELLVDGAEAFPAMEEAIAAAKFDIRALFYIWQVDDAGRRMCELLARKAEDGVRVRVLVDAVGSSSFLRKLAPGLRDRGVRVAGFLPADFRPWAPTFNFRNHRKLLAIDGNRAVIGGMNIGDEYVERWHDWAVGLRGPVVADLVDVFNEDWRFTTEEGLDETPPAQGIEQSGAARVRGGETGPAFCTVIASGPDRDENRIHDAFFLAISTAEERVWLSTPYLVPSLPIVGALRGAAQRGVDVRILTGKDCDVRLVGLASRSYYRVLLESGVRIFEYAGRTLHAKGLLVDREMTFVGSANTDVRSFRLNFELGCFVLSRGFNTLVAEVFEEDVRQSANVSLETSRKEVGWRVAVESAANLLSPLL